MATRKKPSATASKAGKRLRQGDSIAALAENEAGQIKRLKKALRAPAKRKAVKRKNAARKPSRRIGRRG